MPNPLRTQDVTIEIAPETRRGEALQLLRHRPVAHSADCWRPNATAVLDMRGLFLARRGEQLVGAAWGQVIPGRSAFCWPACLVPGEPEDTAVRLQSAVDEYLSSVRVAIVQAVLPVRAATDACGSCAPDTITWPTGLPGAACR